MPDTGNKAKLQPRYLLIALLPALVFSLNQLVITVLAVPGDVSPARVALFNVDVEAAARIAMLACFMLSVAASFGALIFFAYTLLMFERRDRVVPILAFLALAVAAIVISQIGTSREALDYSGGRLACLAASYDQEQSDRARAAEQRALPMARVQVDSVSSARLSCRQEKYQAMRDLGRWQFLGVVLSFAGLVSGAICCLATKASDSAEPLAAKSTEDSTRVGSDDLRHWEHQSQWLNFYLYIAALLLGTALIFINAYLRWPAYLLPDPRKYLEHVGALVSYYGIVFTVMLASFYIPVATILSGKVRQLKPAGPGESKMPDAFTGPLQLLKIVLGLFSTALAGALPGIIDLIAGGH